MGGFVETPCRAFQANTTIALYARVVDTGNAEVTTAAITDGPSTEIGTAEKEALAADEIIPVRLRSAQGTRKMIAAGAISKHAAVYTAANGKVSATAAATSYLRGIAMEEASGDGAIIEVMDVWPIAAESG